MNGPLPRYVRFVIGDTFLFTSLERAVEEYGGPAYDAGEVPDSAIVAATITWLVRMPMVVLNLWAHWWFLWAVLYTVVWTVVFAFGTFQTVTSALSFGELRDPKPFYDANAQCFELVVRGAYPRK